MTAILQLTHRLVEPPLVAEIDGIRLRHYAGPEDIAVWLDLRRRAFARQRIGVGDWDARDFAREFLEKPWWRHECMWFAEARRLPQDSFQPVGTITLARRGTPPDDKPAIHWLAVVPGYRRRGIGRLLVSTVESAVWNAGERQIWLETHSGWEEAARLYAALGYVADRDPTSK
jgi:GNAT superfamily N-acetyltransferase